MPKDTEFFARAAAGELDLTHGARWSRSVPPARPGLRASERSAGAGAARLQGPGRHPGGQVGRPARRAGAADHARGEPGDGLGHRRVPGRERSPGVRRLRALLRRFRRRSRLRAAGRSRPRWTPVPTWSCCATPTAACCRWGSTRWSREVAARGDFRIGIHCQDDTGCAVANTIAAVQAGATHVQCTANGYGERAGNADLFAVVGNLTTKLGMPVLPEGRLIEMMRVSPRAGRVGEPAPEHPPGLRRRCPRSRTRRACTPRPSRSTPSSTTTSTPTVVGNDMHILITEMAGRASVELKASELGRRPGRPARRGHRSGRRGQDQGGGRVLLRGGRRLVRTAAARRDRRRGRRCRRNCRSCSSPTG